MAEFAEVIAREKFATQIRAALVSLPELVADYAQLARIVAAQFPHHAGDWCRSRVFGGDAFSGRGESDFFGWAFSARVMFAFSICAFEFSSKLTALSWYLTKKGMLGSAGREPKRPYFVLAAATKLLQCVRTNSITSVALSGTQLAK